MFKDSCTQGASDALLCPKFRRFQWMMLKY
jgi:hypothetical protein